jgi:hypothetical protein
MENEKWFAIYYSPHQDDEAIAFAGSITEHKEAGRPVILVLLTNGKNHRLRRIMNGDMHCILHDTTHHFNLTMEQVMWARKVEFIESARQLGVDKVYIVDDGQGIDDSLADNDYDGLVARIENVILSFENLYPGASHKLISGFLEGDTDDPGTSGILRSPTHKACWDAAQNLRNRINDFRFYRCYEYSREKENRDAQRVKHLTFEQFAIKRLALEEYKFWDPLHGRFAMGYHSVRDLIDSAFDDPREYVDKL